MTVYLFVYTWMTIRTSHHRPWVIQTHNKRSALSCNLCWKLEHGKQPKSRRQYKSAAATWTATMQKGERTLNGKLCPNNWQIILNSFERRLIMKFMILTEVHEMTNRRNTLCIRKAWKHRNLLILKKRANNNNCLLLHFIAIFFLTIDSWALTALFLWPETLFARIFLIQFTFSVIQVIKLCIYVD